MIPGVLLHGSGSWALGDHQTAKRLLVYEVVGFGTLGVSLGVIAATGAARSLIGPLIATSVIGAGLFGGSLAADWYNVLVPPEARGRRLPIPRWQSQLLGGYVYNPQFEVGGFVGHGVQVAGAGWSVSYEGRHAPLAGYAQWRSAAEGSLWDWGQPGDWGQPNEGGTAAESPSSYVHLVPAFQQLELLDAGQRTWTAELALQSRFDGTLVSPGLRGAFVEFGAGYARRYTRLLNVDADISDDLLLASCAFGVYLPGSAGRGGEARLFYDHRHDGLVGGLLTKRIGSGATGSIGFGGSYAVSERFGLALTSQLGAGWVNTVALVFRPDGATATKGSP